MFIGAHEAEYMFVTTLLKIEQHLLAQDRCPYKLFRARRYGSLINKAIFMFLFMMKFKWSGKYQRHALIF